MIYCKEYQKLSADERFLLLDEVVQQLSRISSASFPRVYEQLTSAESKRRVIQLAINARLQQSMNMVDFLNSMESNLETD